MLVILFLGILLSTSIVPFFFQKKDKFLIAATQFLLVVLIVIAIIYAFYQNQVIHYTVIFLDFNNIKLTLSIQLDVLTKIMMIFILVIGCLIYRYAQNYLESDNTRMRFLSQFNLVLLSVLLLVMAANLLTAFVAWQLIGVNLYLLLNHYHHDPAANRSAKKKFVINRIGDCSFLLSIILAYHTQSAASFSAIQSSPHAELICGLLFISVMTKCAQFPFHIWLIDTMETPTPVSALMHAGVINAGGILLTRVSSALVHFHSLAYLILFVGLISAVFSIHWMNQQPDTKKKLAYSTMGQMGYMLTQCSLGAFPAAIFHLISHGFYKASLFLNAGETLTEKHKDNFEPVSSSLILKSFVISLIILSAEMLLFKEQTSHIPLLMYGFILLTITTLVLKTDLTIQPHWPTRLLYYLVISLLIFAYFYCYYTFSLWLREYEYPGRISLAAQIVLLIAVYSFQYYLWTRRNNKYVLLTNLKDSTEYFLRHFLLNPLRLVGNIINNARYKKTISICYAAVMIFTIICFIYGLFHYKGITEHNVEFSKILIFISLFTGIGALIIANRCLSIKLLLVYLVLFELAFANIAFFDGNSNIVKIGIFHIINVSTVLMMLVMLARQNNGNKIIANNTNRLPTRVFYLVCSLLLLIGIPGTASFISELYLLSALINDNLLFVLMYSSLIILVAIVVMHGLQLYAFNKNYSSLLLKPITRQEHGIFLVIIFLNIICGIWPNILLRHL